jgi:hypothetical protein
MKVGSSFRKRQMQSLLAVDAGDKKNSGLSETRAFFAFASRSVRAD